MCPQKTTCCNWWLDPSLPQTQAGSLVKTEEVLCSLIKEDIMSHYLFCDVSIHACSMLRKCFFFKGCKMVIFCHSFIIYQLRYTKKKCSVGAIHNEGEKCVTMSIYLASSRWWVYHLQSWPVSSHHYTLINLDATIKALGKLYGSKFPQQDLFKLALESVCHNFSCPLQLPCFLIWPAVRGSSRTFPTPQPGLATSLRSLAPLNGKGISWPWPRYHWCSLQNDKPGNSGGLCS